MMTPEEQKEVVAHSRAIAKILYKNTKTENLTSLGKIEVAVRDGLQEHVMHNPNRQYQIMPHILFIDKRIIYHAWSNKHER